MKFLKFLKLVATILLLVNFSLAAQEKSNEQTDDAKISPASAKEEKKANTSSGEPEKPITLNQFLWNDVPFRGFDVLGNKLAQRDNTPYKSMMQAWNLVTGVSYEPTENISIGMNVLNPTAHRANRDNDYFMQSAPGDKVDFTNNFLQSAMTNNPNGFIESTTQMKEAKPTNPRDPSSIQMRKEKNGLKDIFDASFTYKYNTRFGRVVTGFYFANNDNYNLKLGELVAGLEFPFWKALSPTYTGYFRFTSEGGGGGNGTSNHRLSISHKFLPENDINFTTSLAAGYQYHSNLTDYRSGVSDISPKLQINYKSFYISFMDMIRPDSSLWDAPGGFGSSGVYADSNRRDGRVEDPSKVHGAKNQAVVDQIRQGVDNLHAGNMGADPNGYGREALKASLIQSYQQQKFVTHVYYFSIGYSMKF